MNQDFIDFKGKADVLNACKLVISLEPLLDEHLREIEVLEQGHVLSSDTKRRSRTGGYVSGLLQQVNNFIDKNDISLTFRMLGNLKRVREKAEKVLRENIVMQAKSPLDVIKFRNVPVRYAYSSFGGREQRWGYGLHKKPFNEDGESITVARMRPHYVQSVHNHTLSEYSLIIGSKTEGIYYPGKKREQIYSTRNSEIFHFSATTPHTLRNSSDKPVRNMTFKHPAALFDWKPSTHLHSKKIVRARIIRGKLHIVDKTQTKKTYNIHDSYYDYKIIITKLEEGATLESKKTKDHFIFVVKGEIKISHKNIKKICRRNDFVVIDRNIGYMIQALKLSRIYEVSY